MRQEALHVLRTAASDEDEPAATAKDRKWADAQPIPASSSSSSASQSASARHPSEAEHKVKSAKKNGKAAIEIADVELPFGYRKVQPLDYGLTAEEVSAY